MKDEKGMNMILSKIKISRLSLQSTFFDDWWNAFCLHELIRNIIKSCVHGWLKVVGILWQVSWQKKYIYMSASGDKKKRRKNHTRRRFWIYFRISGFFLRCHDRIRHRLIGRNLRHHQTIIFCQKKESSRSKQKLS